ncbi:MAG: formate dehydrogenase subunit gamma [bacterium]
MAEETTQGKRIRRFSTGRIVEHLAHMLLFTILVATGLSQKFYALDVSQWFILRMGGIDTVRFLHHISGFAFTATTVLHIGTGIVGLAVRRWAPSMVITRKDFTDAIHNIRYYLGMHNQPAPCGRFTYKQKFEYWSVLLGALLMIVSGFVLLFPILTARLFPGEIVPASKVLHSNEALLVLLIIAVWHIYNSIFSPDVFPLDTSIFTGSISRERMAREHPLELKALESEAGMPESRQGLENPSP